MYFPIEREVPFVDRAFTFFMHHHVELGVIFFGVIFIALFLYLGIGGYLRDREFALWEEQEKIRKEKEGRGADIRQDVSAAVQMAVDAVLRQRGLL